jgi:hypothetical protein
MKQKGERSQQNVEGLQTMLVVPYKHDHPFIPVGDHRPNIEVQLSVPSYFRQ